MALALGDGGPSWAVPQDGLREAKEEVRQWLYGPSERKIRDEILARLARRFERWRRGWD
jgi:hypothetical protein